MLRSVAPLVLLLFACGRAEEPTAAAASSSASPSVTKPGTRELARRVAAAIVAGDAKAATALVPKQGADVRIEVRQTLVETDERTSETVRSSAELEAWLAKTRPKWSCVSDGCDWPGGLRAGELERCAGDCCFSDWPGGLEKKTLHLRRVCLAAREAGEPRLSYLGFVEAK